MILSKEVEVTWSNRTKGYFTSKGYEFTKLGDIFLVKVEDLTQGSTAKVTAQCVSCSNKYIRPYSQIRLSLDESILKKYYCIKCISARIIDEHLLQQEKGLLKRGDNGFWTFKENVEKEVLKYIELYGDVDQISSRDYELHQAIVADKRPLNQIVEDIGLKWSNISSYNSNHYFKDFGNMEIAINTFIGSNCRFPTSQEMYKTLKIHANDIRHHGGMDSIKEKMNYSDESDLVDDNGFRNKSIMEFKVAQYMIANKIFHRRDVKPFSHRRFTCDFMIENKSNEQAYVEVWGYSKNGEDKISIGYNKVRAEKEDEYSKKKKNLISIEFDEIYFLNHLDFQELLNEKFSPVVKHDLKMFTDASYLHPKGLTDQDILSAIMKHSNVEGVLPTQEILHQQKMNLHLREIRKRHGSYFNFAEAVGVRVPFLKTVYEVESTV